MCPLTSMTLLHMTGEYLPFISYLFVSCSFSAPLSVCGVAQGTLHTPM